MTSRVAVLGAGSWGTTVASIVTGAAPTVLWARRPALAEVIAATGRNPDYLGGPALPASLGATASLAEALRGADVVFMAVPSQWFRAVMSAAVDHLEPGAVVVSLAKGLERGSRLRMTEIIRELAPGHPAGALSGPNLAGEILAGRPAASVVAMAEAAPAELVQHLLTTPAFRVYTNPDVVGCELAGALKNVVAIACGMADGLDLGDNTRAALITRGLAELTRLGTALGGDAATFAGLAGLGDLVVTCGSPASRNRFVGEELGRGRSLTDIVAAMNMVAEGVGTAAVVLELAHRAGVEMPITEQVAAVVEGGQPAAACVHSLMSRDARPERDPLPSRTA
ncbi:MAG: NAD(P)H-dependent glycerol-3-phosphate dehydrogenase [Acidimicrobiales bacterium]